MLSNCRESVEREAAELQKDQATLEQEAVSKKQEADSLERQLQEARAAAAEAERRREAILQESYQMQEPAQHLADEADMYVDVFT